MASPSPTTPALAYRPDIDGLRAFAVLSVVFFHAFPNTLKGGFIGVDIFFVISGYLIGWIIMRDLEHEQFSFLNFYARRIRRIFPALIVVLTVALAFGWFALLPDEYKALGKHAFGGAAFIDNFLLWQESGYFDVSSKLKPFLHLWSLGIEEQFYIFFPLILFLCYKNKLNFCFIISLLFIFSFLDNIYISKIDRTIDFYSPLTRVWELLVGAFIASLVRKRFAKRLYLIADKHISSIVYRNHVKNDGRSLSLVFAILGFSLLLISLQLCRPENWWPAWKALLPVLGASCIILAGPINIFSKYILCNRITVFIGKISYPLYLWHWVLLSYLFIIFGVDAKLRYYKIIIILISIILSCVTYYFIEKSVRFGKNYRNIKNLLLCFLMSALSIIAAYIYFNNGLSTRYSIQKYTEIAHQLKDHVAKDGSCNARYDNNVLDKLEFCRYKNTNSNSTIAIIGDSHSRVAYHGISKLGEIKKYNTLFLGRFQPRSSSNDLVAKLIIEDNKIIKVFIILRGQIYITGMDVSIGYKLNKTNIEPFGIKPYFDMLQHYINIFVDHGKKVYIVTEVPELPESPRDYCERPFINARKFPKVLKKDVLKRQQSYLEEMHKLKNCDIIYTIDKFCDQDECFVYKNGIPTRLDDDHLSFLGSEYLANKVLYNYIVEKLN